MTWGRYLPALFTGSLGSVCCLYGVWGGTRDLVCPCWPGTKLSVTGSCTQAAWEDSPEVGAGLQRARHAQPGISPGSALLIQDTWASHSPGWITCNEWIATVIHMKWETKSWDNGPFARLLQICFHLISLLLFKWLLWWEAERSEQLGKHFACKFTGVLEKRESMISVMVSGFFKKRLSRQHLLGNIFKLCSKGG